MSAIDFYGKPVYIKRLSGANGGMAIHNACRAQRTTNSIDAKEVIGMALGTQLTKEQREAISTLASAPTYANESKLTIFRKLPWNKKSEYFREHFLMPVAAAAIVMALAAFLIVRFISPDARPALYAAVIDDALPTSEATNLQDKLEDQLGVSVIIDDYFDMDKDGLTKLQTMLSSKQIDVIIAPHKTFRQLAGYGYLTNLGPTISKSDNSKLDGATIQLKGFSDADDDGIDSSGTGKGAARSYGLKLSDATGWTSIADSDRNALIGIATSTRNTNTAQRFIDWLYR